MMLKIILPLVLLSVFFACEPCPVNLEVNDRYRRMEPEIAAQLEAINTWGDFTCDIDFLGDQADEIYIRIHCTDPLNNRGFSNYGRVSLDEEGGILSIDLPRDGGLYSQDLDTLFPACFRGALK